MLIAGLQKTTLLDYPGLVASTIFTFGCNMRCPFCHNMNLVENTEEGKEIEKIEEKEVVSFLTKRAGIIEGVCITGGEPTLQIDLTEFISKIKSLGLKVKLDTNGTHPEIIRALVEKNLVDYIAMDIKSSLKEYRNVSGNVNIDTDKIKESIDFLITSNIESEFRTTIVNELHNRNVMEEIGKTISGAKRYYLQSFVDSEYVPCHNYSCASDEDMKEYQEIISKYVNKVEIRGREITKEE